jgi:hypothetical protein
MEEITKEGAVEFLIPVKKIEIFDPDIIKIPLVTQSKYDGPSSAKKKKKKEEVQDIDSEEKNVTSEETLFNSPTGGGGDEGTQEKEGEEEKKDKCEVTPSNDPLTEVETSKKRKGSPPKPSTQRKSQATEPQSQNMLTVDDVHLIIISIKYASEDVLQRHEAKKETMYDRIKKELKEM